MRSVLTEPLPAFLAASEPLALGHAGTNQEESVAAACASAYASSADVKEMWRIFEHAEGTNRP